MSMFTLVISCLTKGIFFYYLLDTPCLPLTPTFPPLALSPILIKILADQAPPGVAVKLGCQKKTALPTTLGELDTSFKALEISLFSGANTCQSQTPRQALGVLSREGSLTLSLQGRD